MQTSEFFFYFKGYWLTWWFVWCKDLKISWIQTFCEHLQLNNTPVDVFFVHVFLEHLRSGDTTTGDLDVAPLIVDEHCLEDEETTLSRCQKPKKKRGGKTWVDGKRIIPRWWFQIFFIFTPTWGNDPIWLVFFKWVETTN